MRQCLVNIVALVAVVAVAVKDVRKHLNCFMCYVNQSDYYPVSCLPLNGKNTNARFLASFSSFHTISISIVSYDALHDVSADAKQPALPICTQSVSD